MAASPRKENNMTGIYMIKNKLNNKVYIGQSVNVEQRFRQHKAAIKGSDKSWYPQAREESNSLEDFDFRVLQECKKEELDELEEYWVNYYDSFNTGYNVTKDGQCITNGKVPNQRLLMKAYVTPNIIFDQEELKNAYKLLKGNAIRLWLYFINHSKEVPFLISSESLCKECDICRNTYTKSMRNLMDEGYLVNLDNEKDVFIFYSSPQN